jgi:hypothetical protein
MAAKSLDESRLAAVIAEVLHRHPAGGLAVGAALAGVAGAAAALRAIARRR